MLQNMLNHIRNRILPKAQPQEGALYEFCPRCDANITLQKGYRNDLPYWICLGCGEMLINPAVESNSDICWICDRCEAMLNIQPGFREECAEWTCTECGYVNRIDADEIYSSDDEYRASCRDPYRGLTDEEVLALSLYRDVAHLEDRPDIILVRHMETGRQYVKKLLTVYDRSVYAYLQAHPVQHMPGIVALYESSNCLIVIEEYIAGQTVAERLDGGTLPEPEAVGIAREICDIISALHHLDTPIIHRDIKPSNIILSPEGEIWLLDMNAAKWYDPEETDDTRYMGTQSYAAPEQAGYGMTASFGKTDIYAVGMLLNVMITGFFPKEKRAGGRIWDIIERCIRLEAEERYTDDELRAALDRYLEEWHAEETHKRAQ